MNSLQPVNKLKKYQVGLKTFSRQSSQNSIAKRIELYSRWSVGLSKIIVSRIPRRDKFDAWRRLGTRKLSKSHVHLTGGTARNDEFPEGLMRSLEGKLLPVRNERRHPGIGWYVLFFRPPPFRNVVANDAELLFCFERSSLLVSPLGVHTTSAIVTRVLHSSSYQDSLPPSLSLSVFAALHRGNFLFIYLVYLASIPVLTRRLSVLFFSDSPEAGRSVFISEIILIADADRTR